MSCRFWLSVVVVVSVLGTWACTRSHDLEGPGLGDDDVDASVEEDDPAGRGGSGGTGGMGGGAAMAGRGGAAAGSGGVPPACRNCPAPAGLAGFLMAESCCTATGTCGLTAPAAGVTDCLQMNAPGVENASCPEVIVSGIFPLAGCCAADGTCGALDVFIGLGCAKFPGTTNARCTP